MPLRRDLFEVETKKYKIYKQMKRTIYEAPQTIRLQVELESGFCAASQMPASISNDTTIEVEKYDSFEMGVTFE